nr:DUF1275 family protein [Streptomyces sp. RPA4-2]
MVTGAGDAISFLALGGVFTSVMTANLALLGLAVGSRDLILRGHTHWWPSAEPSAARLSLPDRHRKERHTGRRGSSRPGPRVVGPRWLLVCWMATSGMSESGTRIGLLASAALAMGCQGGLVRGTGGRNVSTAPSATPWNHRSRR